MLIGYMRISTNNDRQTTDLQRDALLQAGVDERHLFMDQASGIKDERQGLSQALTYLKKGDCLIVWKLDRLGRSLPHLLEVISELNQKGIIFKSLTENIDTSTPHGELFFHIFGALAQYERSLIRERIMAGLEAAKIRGKKGGRPRKIDDEKLHAILNSLKDGQSKASVCRTFQIPRTTLYDYLSRIKNSAV
ncbi:MAG: recombinase family protein [Candidatus Paracaedibacteraceae bacterium]|nr:recombinase family protein [Candidatus Paracaedibacteraceae bacterium]